MISIVKIVCTIIGTFIGAGFASGKEIYLFFYKYGMAGTLGIIISSVIIGYIIFKVIIISKKNKIENYDEFLDYILKNEYLKICIKKVIDLFLIISFCVMISGFCAFMNQEFNINFIFSYILILSCCNFILKKNVSGIIKINNVVIPIIIFIILFISFKKIDLNLNIIKNIDNKFNINFIFSSILYANYNLLTVIPIIITINKFAKNKKQIKSIGILSAGIICALSLCIYFILAQSNDYIRSLDMPVVFIVGGYGNIYKYIYCLIIGTAIFTTAISVGYGYLQKFENIPKKYNRKIILLIICAVLSIPIGFSKLVEVLYPIFGFLGLVQSFYIIRMH